MNKYTKLMKGMLVFCTSLAILFTTGTAVARWDELIDPAAPYVVPQVQEEEVVSLPPGIYRVEIGDTLSQIADKFGVTMPQLVALNNLTDQNQIYEGQVIRLPLNIVSHRVVKGETLSQLAFKYSVSMSKIASYNNLHNTDLLLEGTYIRIPMENGNLEGGHALPAFAARSLPVGKLPWPVSGWISSSFGMREGGVHEGLDIAADMGEPIRAMRDGRVSFSGSRGTYGLTVIIDHGDGLTTLYAHCSELLVKEGDRVSAGQLIARVGSTGRSTGPHLHLEVRLDGVPYDPVLCLKRMYA